MKSTKKIIQGLRREIDLASFRTLFKLLIARNRNNSPPALSRGARLRVLGFHHAMLKLIKSTTEQANSLSRWLQSVLLYLLDKFFFLSRFLIVIGLHSGACLFLGLSILETLSNYPDVSWKPYAGFIAFGSPALASRLTKNKNNQRD